MSLPETFATMLPSEATIDRRWLLDNDNDTSVRNEYY